MKYISVNGKSSAVDFRDALFQGIAPDGGLYMPKFIPKLSFSFFEHTDSFSLQTIGEEVASLFIDEIPRKDLRNIITNAFNFPISLVPLDENIFLLELFHGPTLAFKDVGARFMANTLSFFLQQVQKDIAIIVATSGDTGSAVAQGFLNVPNISVYVLYPSGKISKLQEKQITTLGNNIYALEINGTFDDCQHLVKQALADSDLVSSRNITTANSINIGRLIPQICYYVWASFQLDEKKSEPIIVVPSGNFGNLTAAIISKLMGATIQHFVAATNANDAVPQYFSTGKYFPRTIVHTISNAMDVGNPSNLSRIQFLFNNDIQKIKKEISAISISDSETLEEIQQTYEKTNYILDPHTAVGVRAARKRNQQLANSNQHFIVAATAHYGKFPEVVERAIGKPITIPPSLQSIFYKEKKSFLCESHFPSLKNFLLSN